jgi:peroxiredoxin (alkyl hydroperoxide reductase subunit C)
MIKLNDIAPKFKTQSFHNHEFKEVKLEDYKGKFVVLFFYPADFTFVCPTELEDMADNYSELKNMNVEVLSVSTDTQFVHAAWHADSPKIGKIKFPMLADPTHEISKAYNVLRDGQGVADRATFVIDPEGLIKAVEITDEPIGRNATELIRKIKALQFARENPNLACPAKWEPGKDTLKPGLDLVGKL